MALLQISEPGMSTAPHQHRLAVGIDLGTTNSLVATVRSGKAETLADLSGQDIVPSVVSYGDDKIRVGHEALKHQIDDALNTVSSAKRFLGRSISELRDASQAFPYIFVDGASEDSQVPAIKTRRGNVTAIEVSAEILKTLKARAEATLGDALGRAVITVPAYFDDAQRQATRDAAKLAGLKVLRLLNEPTAAAVAYGIDQQLESEERLIAVYDLGGGTFDISILRLNKGVFEVLATGGDSSLGGDDFDQVLANYLLEQINPHDGKDIDPAILREALLAARKLKETLSDTDVSQLELQGHAITVHRDTLNELIEALVKKTLLSCRRALRDADIEKTDIHDVVMVGGSTRVPLVRQRVGQFFETEPLVSIDPDKVVAMGAAIQADILIGNKPDGDMLLLDVIPLSLGIETYGGLVEKIISRNTTIPIIRAQEFTTFKDNQTAMSIHILQGERETVEQNRSLARFSLKDIPPMVAGAARIKVSFQVDADGLLNVLAEETSTGVQANIEVKPSYGLSDGEIESMITDSLEHAREDVELRRLREQQVEADRTLEALDAAMESDAEELLTTEEQQLLLTEKQTLFELRTNSQSADELEAGIKQLEKTAEFYVARRMDNNVRKAMQGQTVDAVEQQMSESS